jgi:hypothetical protein
VALNQKQLLKSDQEEDSAARGRGDWPRAVLFETLTFQLRGHASWPSVDVIVLGALAFWQRWVVEQQAAFFVNRSTYVLSARTLLIVRAVTCFFQ